MANLLSDDQAWAKFIAGFDGDDQEAREQWANNQPPLIASLDPNDAEDCNHAEAFMSGCNQFICPTCGLNEPWPN